jgi:hypothetical protein
MLKKVGTCIKRSGHFKRPTIQFKAVTAGGTAATPNWACIIPLRGLLRVAANTSARMNARWALSSWTRWAII